jgi:succinate dehydrogenase / fumarate reductase cytochrome b subunit
MSNLVGTISNSLRYRGRDGQWAWMLHRITGLGVVLFLLLHIFDIFLMAAGKDAFEDFLALYTAPPFRLLEAGLIFAVIYHALNGTRVIIVDFWPQYGRHQKILWRLQMALAILLSVPAVIITIKPIFTG